MAVLHYGRPLMLKMLLRIILFTSLSISIVIVLPLSLEMPGVVINMPPRHTVAFWRIVHVTLNRKGGLLCADAVFVLAGGFVPFLAGVVVFVP